MVRTDPSPLPYGALPYYQAHYIVNVESEENQNLIARCKPITKGHFGNKRVVDVRWEGGNRFAKTLQEDAKLTQLLKEVLLQEGEIRVDPQDDHVRIYGKWIHEDRFALNATMLEAADRIAMHIRQKLVGMGAKV